MTNGSKLPVGELQVATDVIEYELDGETHIGTVYKWTESGEVGKPSRYRVWVCPGDSIKPCNPSVGTKELVSFEASEDDTFVLVKRHPKPTLGKITMTYEG